MAKVADNYEINVAKKRNLDDKYGVHFCRIQLRQDIYEDKEAEKMLDFFRKLFGKEYHVSMTHWKCHGEAKKEWD